MPYYAWADDDLALTASGVTASAEDPGYLAANLINENPARPARLTTPSGYWDLAFGSPITVGAAALIYQYFDEDLDVTIEGTDVVAFTIPAKRRDGPSNQRWTTNPFVIFPDPQTSDAWRLSINAANSQNACVGRLMLIGTLRQVDIFHDGDIQEDDAPDNQREFVQPTEAHVEIITPLFGPRRGWTLPLIGTDLSAGSAPVQAASDFRDLMESANGRERPFLVVPRDNDALLVRPESSAWPRSHRQGGSQHWMVPVREVSRGLPPAP